MQGQRNSIIIIGKYYQVKVKIMWVVFNKIIWINRRNGIKLTQKCIKLIKHWHKDKIADTKFGVNGNLTTSIITIIGKC